VQPDDELRRILLRAFPGCRIEECKELGGGVSARAVVANLVLRDTTTRRVVVRRPHHPTAEDTLRMVSREHELLSRCIALGIPAPRPCFLDAVAAALVLEHVEGAPEFAPASITNMLHRMATQLALIHRVTITGEFGFLKRRNDSAGRDVLQSPTRLDRTLDEPRLRAALAGLWPWHQYNADALLHGDYWPGNLLWKGGELVAVLDWEEAEIGDPLADVAVSRLDILWAFGEEAMHTFTQGYREQTRIDWRNLARWDLCVALRPMSNLDRWAQSYAGPPICRPDVTELSMREGHRRFVHQALRSLGIDR
jgi:aminoglycoside phosphotransferase (APT) family kinase protein